MRALLHYALLKSLRERSLWAFLFAPLMLVGAPMLGIAAEAAINGRRLHPILLSHTSLLNSERMYIYGAMGAAVAAAAAAAFWCFRSDVANRSLSFMLLALPRPVAAPLTAALFGWCAGAVAFLLMIPLVAAATGIVSRTWLPVALIAAIASVAACAMGTAFAAYAPAPGTLMMVVWAAVILAGVTAGYLDEAPLPVIATAIAAAAFLIAIAARGMERRCAA